MPWFIVDTESKGTHALEFADPHACDKHMCRIGYKSWKSTPYATEEAALASLGTDKPCKECGKRIDASCWNEETTKELLDHQLCFGCNFWRELVEGEPGIRINGQHYQSGGMSNSPWRGFGGQHFKIELASGEIIETNNLWTQGSIPSHFAERLQDNAKFL